jgi:DNA-binding transcriptional MerR regulator
MRLTRKKRRRRGYVRKSRATPQTGWTARELAQLSGISLRTLRMYLQRGVLPRSPFKGAATRYQRSQLLWLLAIRRLREQEHLELDAIRARLTALAPEELEAFATAGLSTGKLAEALGLRPVSVSSAVPPSLSMSSAGPRWARIELALGLELHVRDDSSPRVLALARQLREWCVSATEPTT